ncbi:MAG: polymorphic toxin-type HINT domain-containing protein, partial [Parahaliea sp.]
IRQIVSAIGQGLSDPGSFEHQLYSNHMMPVRSTTVVRMQSDAWENELMASIGDQATVRQQGGPEEQTVSDVSGAGETGEAVPGTRGGYQGSQARNYVPQNSGGSSSGGGASGSWDSGGGVIPEESLCEPVPEPATEEDGGRGFFGSLWNDLKDMGVAAYNFVRGFWDGIKNQISDIVGIITDPIETAKGLYKLGKAFINDPEGTAKAIFGELYEDFETVLECGAYDRGRIIGEYINPVFMLKIATHMAKLSRYENITDAIRKSADDLGCPPNSFAADTLVWTPNGQVAIDTIRVGDIVFSRNDLSFDDKPQRVSGISHRTANDYYQIVTEGDAIKITDNHPVWVQAKGWVSAEKVEPYDVIATIDGDATVYFVNHFDEPLEVYNFSVEQSENYFVGNEGLWVHNTATCKLSGPISDLKNQRTGDLGQNSKTGRGMNSEIGLVGEGKVNLFFEKELGMTWYGDPAKRVDPDNFGTQKGIETEFARYVGTSGIDSLYEASDGTIYIIESKASGSKEWVEGNNRLGQLSKKPADGQQMSKGWLTGGERLKNAGLDRSQIAKVENGLGKNDGSVVRLYAGTDTNGQTKFYEITDVNNYEVTVSDTEYVFP